MRKLLHLFFFNLFFVSFSIAQSDSATYTLGDISVLFDNNPTTNDNSFNCTDTLTVTIPAGNLVTGVDLFYDMEAVAGNNGWQSDQRSYLEYISVAPTAKEAAVTNGPAVNGPGTANYSRTALALANGVSASGNLQFVLHAFRTFSNNPACNNTVQRVVNNTWKIVVHHSAPPSCLPPSNLVSTGSTNNSIDLNWTTGGATNWLVGYRITGSAAPLSLVSATLNPFTLTGLSAGTSYDLFVRDSCGVNDVSTWIGPITVTTQCNAVTAPWLENFDGASWVSGAGGGNGGDAIDLCWSRPGTGNPNFSTRQGPTNTGGSGPVSDASGAGKYIYTEASGGATGAGEITSPLITIPNSMTSPQLRFFYHMFGGNITSLEVQVDNGTGFGPSIHTITGAQQNANNDPWLEDTVNLSAYLGNTIRLKFIGTNTGFNGDISIDEVEIREKPTCFRPTTLTSSNSTNSSVDLSWTTGGATNWQVGYRTLGSTAAYTIVSATTNPFTLTSLSAGTQYEMAVKDSCASGNSSIWSDTTVAATLCNAFNAPWSENFDGPSWNIGTGFTNAGNTIDICWSRPDANGPNFGTGTGATGTGATGPLGDVSGAGNYIYTEASGGATGTGEITTPSIVVSTSIVNPTLEFSYHMFGANITSLEIQVDNGNGFGPSLKTISGQQQTANADAWLTDTLDLTQFSGDTIRIKFLGANTGLNGDIAIDEVSVDVPPPCPDPSLLAFDFTWINSATLSWTTGGASDWQLEYGAPGFSLGTGTIVNVSSNPGQITGLTSNTTYDVYVRDSCGPGLTSAWVGPVSFSTLCTAVGSPFTENFDNFTVWDNGGANTALGTIDACWSRTPTNPFAWKAGPHVTTSNFAGPSTDHTTGTGGYIYSERLAATTPTVNAFIQTPPIDLTGLTTPQLNFWYHMFGNSIVDLEVDINNGSGWTNIFALTGQQQTSGTDPWKEAIISLAAYASDTVVVRFRSVNNNGGTNNDISIDDVMVDNAPSCPQPQNLAVSGFTNTTATLSWTTGGANEWNIEYGAPGFTQGTGTYVTANSNPFTVTGLTPNTAYQFYVRDSCGTNDVSVWVGPDSVTTDCNPFTAPFSEDFDGAGFTVGGFGGAGNLDACWQRDLEAGYVWTPGQNGTPSAGTGPSGDNTSGTGKYVYTETFFGTFNPNVTVLSTPLVDISPLLVPELKFYYHMFGPDIISLDVRVFDGTAWTNVLSLAGQQNTSNADPWIEAIVDLTAYTGDTIKVDFTATKQVGVSIQADIAIDDISIDEKPACPKPSNLATSSATANSIDLSWTTGGATDWLIEYGPAGFTPGTGTYVAANSNPFTVTGLNGSTTYDFYVADSCGVGSVSDWEGPVTDNTLCTTVSAPYLETFDGSNFDPGPNGFGVAGTIDACWGRNPAATYFWKTGPSTPQTGGTGPSADHTSGSGGYLFTESGGFAGPPLTAEATTPSIDLSPLTTPELSYWYHMFGNNVNDLYVEISNDGGTSYTGVDTLNGNQQNGQTDPWKEAIIDISAYANDTIIIRFRAEKTSFGNQSDIAIDDVSVDEAPSCPKPTALTPTGRTSTTITVSWTTGGASNWQIEFGPSGFANGSGTLINVGSNPFTITGLTPQTNYDIYVRDSCAVADVSDWSEVADTLTDCGVLSAPWSENFDGSDWTTGFGALNGGSVTSICWVKPNNNNPNFSTRTGTTASGGTGPNSDISGAGNYIYTESSGGAQGTGEINTPSIFIPSTITSPRLTFGYHMFGPNIDSLQVQLSANGGAFTRITSLVGQQQNATSDPWLHEIVDLTAYSGDTVRIKFLGTNSGFAGDMAIDSVVIEQAPNCPSPLNIVVSPITSTSATLSWTTGGATNWQIEYGPTGFTSGTGTIVSAGTNPFTITGLTPSTGYDFYVRDSCGAGNLSLWSAPVTDTTQCSPFVAPYTETFDGPTFVVGGSFANPGSIDPCWDRTFATSYFWAVEQNGTLSNNTGPSADHTTGAGKFMFTDGNGGQQQTNLTSPSIDLTQLTAPELRFWYHMYGAAISKMDVEVSNNGGGTWSNVRTLTGQQQNASADPWIEAVVSLSAYQNDTIQIRFIGERVFGPTSSDMAIDDVWVGDSTSCTRPDSLILVSATTTSITIQWNGGTSLGSKIRYRPANTTGAYSFVTSTSNTVTISGLNPSTIYEVSVQDSCGANDLSQWANNGLFSTLCGAIVAPWNEDFDGPPWLPGAGIFNAGSQINPCWTRVSPFATEWGTRFGGTPSNNTGPNGDAGGGGQYIYMEASQDQGARYIQTPSIYIPSSLNIPRFFFDYHLFGADIDSLDIQIDNGSGFNSVLLFTGQQQTSSAAAWQGDSVDLGAYLGDTIIIRFVGVNTGFAGDISLDNFNISTKPPSVCNDPTSISFTLVSNTSATVNWVSNSGNSEVEVVQSGLGQGNGTTYNNVTSPLNLTGLTPGTTYEVYIRDICTPTLLSNWVVDSFTTTVCPLVVTSFTYNANLLDVNFDGSATIGQDTLVWDFGNGTIGTNPTQLVSYAAPGTYTVSLYAANACGNSDTLTQTITICDSLTADFNFTLSNDTLNVDASTSVGASTYFFDFGDGTTDSSAVTSHFYGQSGNYTIKLVVTNPCGVRDSITRTVMVCGNPVADWTYNVLSTGVNGMTVQFDASASLNATSFAWDFGDGNTNNVSALPVHTYVVPGLFYTVSLTVTNTCNETHNKTFRLDQIGLEELVLENQVQVYPNPAQNYLNIEFGTPINTEVALKLYDVSGKEILANSGERLSDSMLQLYIGDVPKGIYMLKVFHSETITNIRVVKE